MIANIIVDVVLVLIMLIGVIIGIKKGFINTVAKPVKLVLAIFLGYTFSSALAAGIIQPLITAPLTAQITEFLNTRFADVTAETADSLPTLVKLAAGLCGVNIEDVASTAEGQSVISAVISSITDPVIQIVSTAVAFILIYLVAQLALTIVVAIINAIVDNGFVGVINRILGCVFTFCLSFIIAWALCALSEFVLSLPAFAEAEWAAEFTGGYIYKFFKSFSPIDILLSF